jgi:hypothetical protein
VENWLPTFCGGEEDCQKGGAGGADDGVEKSGKGELGLGALKLLDCFVEVDNGIKKGEDFAAKGRDVAHCPVVGVEESEDEVHPAGVDEGPGHEWKEGDLQVSIFESFAGKDVMTYAKAVNA